MDERAGNPRTSEQILDIAQRLVQTRGYNAFSYGDIANELGVTKASLHYHFPAKGDLGVKLIDRYDRHFGIELERIEAAYPTAPERLRKYVEIYALVLADQRMCLCGMLAAEFSTLPGPMQTTLDQFFAHNEKWLIRVLEDGRLHGSLNFIGTSSDMAQFLIGSLEGLMMMARSHGDLARFEISSRRLLAEIGIADDVQ